MGRCDYYFKNNSNDCEIAFAQKIWDLVDTNNICTIIKQQDHCFQYEFSFVVFLTNNSIF